LRQIAKTGWLGGGERFPFSSFFFFFLPPFPSSHFLFFGVGTPTDLSLFGGMELGGTPHCFKGGGRRGKEGGGGGERRRGGATPHPPTFFMPVWA